MARCKSPPAFLGILVKAEVENCDFCALRQDKGPGRKPVLFCLCLGTSWCPGSWWQPHGQAKKYPGFKKLWEKNLDVSFCMPNTSSKFYRKLSKERKNSMGGLLVAGSVIPLQRCPEITAVSVLVSFSFSTLPIFSLIRTLRKAKANQWKMPSQCK